MNRIAILGATSAIATEVARLAAREGKELFLAARDSEQLKLLQDDLTIRGAKRIVVFAGDLADIDAQKRLFSSIEENFSECDSVLLAYGTLSDQEKAESDLSYLREQIYNNFTSAACLLTWFGNRFGESGYGVLAAIGSVAGDRGRQSNFVYGAAKGGLEIFLAGLRNRLFQKGVNVVTIKPGYVDTPMTSDVEKNALFATPDKVAKDIYDAMKRGKEVVYTPWFWRFIMLIIRSVPEGIFKYQRAI